MRRGFLQKRKNGKIAECLTCLRRCVIKDGASGYCGTRVNRDGVIYTMTFGIVSSMAVSPIEKKPIFHFYPGSLWLSVGSFGCNFRCPGCQNWDIAHSSFKKSSRGYFIPPEELVKIAERNRCDGISWTYNEPALSIEYILECAMICKERRILTNLVSNGSFTDKALKTLIPYLDSIRIDIKGFRKESYRKITHYEDFEGILRNIKTLKSAGIHFELITNVIPEFNDNESEIEEEVGWILKNLGDETPLHFTRFFPHRFLSHIPPTPIETLEKFRRIAMNKGLKYVYIGNVPGHPGENTFCPNCNKLIIERYSIQVVRNLLKNGKCPFCNFKIYGEFPLQEY
ncbi:MAG: AmmeMemoRadiSam system radical SAM enzyme [Candidatus Aminicenantia bacterium]